MAPIRTCIVFLNHVQNLHIHAVRAKILYEFFLHEYVNFVHGPEKPYRSLSTKIYIFMQCAPKSFGRFSVWGPMEGFDLWGQIPPCLIDRLIWPVWLSVCIFNWGSGTLACSIGLKIRCCRQQYGSPVRPDHKRAVNRVGDAEVLAEDGRVWGRHRRDRELVGVFRGSWGGILSVGRERQLAPVA